MKRVYFDNAATTAIRQEVIDAMTEVLSNHYGNPSSIHASGRSSRALIEQSRKTVANLIGASIGEIFFTSGGTESNNMALKCAVRDLGVQRIISCRTEHHCILHTLDSLEKSHSINVVYLDNDEKGCIEDAQLEALLADSNEKTLVSLMHSNNEIGTMIDLEALAVLCEKHGAYLHTDTVQTIGHYPIDVSKTRISFLSGSAHKFHGPKGIGFIYINGDNIIQPMIDGGSQERNMRGGTENIYGIVGLAKALEHSCAEMEENRQHISALRSYLIEKLEEHFEDIRFNGDYQGRFHYKVLNVSFPPSPKSDLLLLNLDIHGISASGGSACSSGAEAGSHVLSAIGIEEDRKSIRFSFAHTNTKEDIDYLIEQLRKIIPVREVVTDRVTARQ
ncbi:MAG: cysteine desulfurase family protein [Bacteroidota bacterium]